MTYSVMITGHRRRGGDMSVYTHYRSVAAMWSDREKLRRIQGCIVRGRRSCQGFGYRCVSKIQSFVYKTR